jgi:ribonuclease inhibitor
MSPWDTRLMAEVTLNGSEIKSEADFYEQFFERARGLMADYGGRNLDALHDDLRELTEPLTVAWKDSERSQQHLGDWFERVVDTLRAGGSFAVTVELR